MSRCAECGHDHFEGPDKGYAPCPVDECECQGQLWAQTPVEIDTALYALYVERQTLAQDRLHALNGLHYACNDQRDYQYGRGGSWRLTDAEALAKCEDVAGNPTESGYVRDQCSKAIDKLAQCEDALEANHAASLPGEAEYVRRGRWTRAYLVTDGHVHSSMDCSTCYPTTLFSWLTSLSDHDEAEIVEQAASRACTVCYPTAPTLRSFEKASPLFTEEEAERNAKREQAKADKAARDEAKIAKGLTSDGSPFEVRYLEPGFEWMDSPNPDDPDTLIRTRVETTRPTVERFKTERAAELWYVSELADVQTWSHKRITQSQYDALTSIVHAIAVKHDEPMGDVKARLDAKVAAKVKRDS